MSKFVIYCLIGVCISLLMVNQVTALQCYVCNLDASCNDEFSSAGVNVTECSGSCYKTKYETGVLRGCSPISYPDECVTGNFQGLSADMCACGSNLCNEASSAHLGFGLMLTSALSTLYFSARQ